MTDKILIDRITLEHAVEACSEVIAGWQSLAPLALLIAATESLDELRAEIEQAQQRENALIACTEMLKDIDTLIRKQEQKPEQEPVAFLANGTRFKISYDSHQNDWRIHGIPPELNGRWVAFVAAEDDCHMKLTHAAPPPQEWVSLTDEEIAKEGANCWFGGLNYGNEKFARLIESRLREKNGGGK